MLKARSDSRGTEGSPESPTGFLPAAILQGWVNPVNDRETTRVPRSYMT